MRQVAHRIRLRDGWETTVAAGVTRQSRRFGRPRTLDADERVWLFCEQIPAAAEITINGHLLGRTEGPASFSADVTVYLEARNTLIISQQASGILAAVYLEIGRAEEFRC